MFLAEMSRPSEAGERILASYLQQQTMNEIHRPAVLYDGLMVCQWERSFMGALVQNVTSQYAANKRESHAIEHKEKVIVRPPKKADGKKAKKKRKIIKAIQ